VRQLIDEHITVLDLDHKIPPVRITDVDFKEQVAGLPSARARASEMEHAIRHHIRTHLDEDPARYQKLSERLHDILNTLDLQWEQQAFALELLIDEMTAGPIDDGTGLDPAAERPFHGVLAQGAGPLNETQSEHLIELTRRIVGHVREAIDDVGFWGNAHKQDQLRKWIKRELDLSDLFPSLAVCDQLAAQLVDLARHNHHRLVTA
jgi:type I restriction enzyme, R subunit